MSPGASPSLVMLVLEDNPADVLFLQEAVEAAGVVAGMHVVSTGEDALRFLRRQPPFAAAPRPDVVVMDLNVPIKNGKEVMAEMTAEPGLCTLPVAVLTTSNSESHVCNAYSRGRCRYFTKTDDFRRLQEIVREIAAHAEASRGA